MKISVIILTHNDADRIGKTLDSVAFADEVIVVDDFSKDQTVEIAKKSGATVYVRKLDDDFAAQRNFGLSKAKGEWVMFVDSDEVLTEALKKEIESKISGKNQSNAVGYYVKRTDVMYGKELKYGETANVRLLRLAMAKSGIWVEPVHETWNIKGETDTLEHPLLHYPHQNVAQFLREINRYSTIRAKFLVDNRISVPGWQIIVYPVGKFIQNYVVKLGFLDGIPGFIMAMMMSFHSYLVRSKAYLAIHTA